MKSNKSTTRAIAALAAACAALILLYWLVFSEITAEDIRSALQRYGSASPAVYILLFAVLPAFFFPVAVLALAGGLMFGLVWGSVYTFIGAIINCALMFIIARYAGRESVQRLIRQRLPESWRQRLGRAQGREGFLLLIVLRLIPAVPYNLINYAFGLTDMPLGAYMLGSAIGIIPGTLAFINIGDKADLASPSFWLAIALMALLLAATALLGKRLFPKDKEDKKEGKKEDKAEKEEGENKAYGKDQ